MELTLDQALKQGVAAHKEGKLQDAERLYSAILQVQPTHPDANHNLGILAVAVGKPIEAIPLFKLALEANPQIEQFWLSYIDALITLERFDEAELALVEGENSGVSPKKLDAFNQRLQGNVANNTNKTAKGQTLSEKRKVQDDPSGAQPSQDQISHLQGHYQAGRWEEAEALATSITQHFPKHPFGWKVLGAVLKQAGRLGESLAPMQTAAKLSPQDAEVHSNLGAALQELGKSDEAESSLRQAIALNSDYANAHYNLGVTLKELGRFNEAGVSLRQAIALKPDHTEAHNNLGVTLKELGRLNESIRHFKQAIELQPDFTEARVNLSSAVSSAVPGWHFPMMNDEVRNNAYSDALKLAVRDGDFVLDIGTGSGLLSLMASASGAEMVIACETSETIADAASEIIKANEYAKKISVINKKSTDLIIGVDLPQQADLVISEVLSSELVGEGVRATVLDANRRLLKKGGRTIPQSGKIKIALIENSPEIFNNTSVASVHGFDLSVFNSLSQKKYSAKLRDKPVLLSSPEDAFNINLSGTEEAVGQEKIVELRVDQDGLCVGLIQWIWIHLYGEVEYENKPGECDSHWRTPIYFFDQPVAAKKGDVFKIKAVLGEDYVWFYQLA